MIRRSSHLRQVDALLRRNPVVSILGARQIGKTTLAREVARTSKRKVHWFDLEDARDVARLQDPMAQLPPLKGLVVLDEIQRRPDLFPALRVLADRPRKPARFLVLGSASPELLKQSSESLAGRIHHHALDGLSLAEVGEDSTRRLLLRGGFPRSFLARTNAESMAWRRQFIETFLQRDLPQLGITTPAAMLRQFWTMVAHYHGQVWNGSELARSLGVSQPTVRRYLDLLEATFVVRRLQPWHENLKKRQVKSPKVYLDDTGLLHCLLNLPSQVDLDGHPKAGASWESFAIRAVVARLGARWEECYFWATHQGAELDLLVVRGKQRLAFEFKRTAAPRVTPSMRIAMSDLGLRSLRVVHIGDHSFPMAEGIRAVALADLESGLRPLR